MYTSVFTTILCLFVMPLFAQGEKNLYEIILRNGRRYEGTFVRIERPDNQPIFILADSTGEEIRIDSRDIQYQRSLNESTPSLDYDPDFVQENDTTAESDRKPGFDSSGLPEPDPVIIEGSFSIQGGFSKSLGERSSDWKSGFALGANYFKRGSGSTSLGVHLAYNRWPINGEEWFDVLADDYDYESASGTHSIIEIVPTLRISLSTLSEDTGNDFFVMGAGLFIEKISEVTLKGSGRNSTIEIELDQEKEVWEEHFHYGGWRETTTRYDEPIGGMGYSKTKFGVQFGLQIVIGDQYEFQPLIHYIFAESKSLYDYKNFYFTVNAGLFL